MANWRKFKITEITAEIDSRLTVIKFTLDGRVDYNNTRENHIYFVNSAPFNTYQRDDEVEIDLDKTYYERDDYDFRDISVIRKSVGVKLERETKRLKELTEAAKRKLSGEAHYLLDLLLEEKAELIKRELKGVIRIERIKDDLRKKLGNEELQNILKKREEVSKLELEYLSDNTHEAQIEISFINNIYK